jgi:hypothetical protein
MRWPDVKSKSPTASGGGTREAPMSHAHDAGSPPAAALTVRAARLWTWAVGAGLVAGLAAWFVGERLLVAYHGELTPTGGGIPKPEVGLALIAAKKLVATLTFLTLGATLGLALGIAGGCARWCLTAAGRAGLAGLVLGGVAASGAALVLLPVYFAHHDPLDDSLVLPLMTHAGVAASIGAAGGLALGLGLVGPVRGRGREARSAG